MARGGKGGVSRYGGLSKEGKLYHCMGGGRRGVGVGEEPFYS